MFPDKKNNNENAEKSNSNTNPDEPVKSAAAKDEHVQEAYQQAEEDIEHDPDTSVPEPADDLDEGESVNLDDDENDLV